MHCYLVTDDCASMGRRRAERSRESERQWQAERERERERDLSLNTYNYCRIDEEARSSTFQSSALHQHEMMVLFYESLQMEEGAVV